MSERLPVVPEVLKWARLTAGMTVKEVAAKIRKNMSPSIVEEWENGTASPTYAQLEKLALKIYKRPIALFFFPVPPDEPTIEREFRHSPRQEIESLSPKARIMIRRARAYQLSMRELFGDRSPIPLQVWKSIELSLEKAAESQADIVRQNLILPKRVSDQREMLNAWRSSIEKAGIFVFRGPLGDRDISGFCLYDESFPIILLNSSNAKARQIFTLLHELAHLLLRRNGICRVSDENPEIVTNNTAETFCDRLAAEMLLPSKEFEAKAQEAISRGDKVPCESLSAFFCVSEETALRRLHEKGFIDALSYRAKYEEIHLRQNRLRQEGKDKGGGRDRYANVKSDLSSAFVSGVLAGYYNGRITKEEAADHLNIKPKHFDAFEDTILNNPSSLA
jgi:Zn-dependent peptidase ImmA (M78 family)